MATEDHRAAGMRTVWRITALGLVALAGAVLGLLANFVGSGWTRAACMCSGLVLLTVALVLMHRIRRELRAHPLRGR